ncbi:hypothetical protein GR925_10745 [Streptomyces sp. HUCO-GS316]|uniref:hypothetical protein n=1 Tax=Streptomyces sp. HUCO-GS316 TaxID=2692198 RepID=UPI00136A16CA|nr:hypothetical protein [Streptomyces sp. HUCO-GS316]MXM63911.1 hypothetical protein [Streptomyces sp. HUCO-GS316]
MLRPSFLWAMGMTPAAARAGFHTSTLKMFARRALPYVVVRMSGNFLLSRSVSGPPQGSHLAQVDLKTGGSRTQELFESLPYLDRILRSDLPREMNDGMVRG